MTSIAQHEEQCHVCGGTTDVVRTVWRCEACGRAVCTHCLADLDAGGLYCRACEASGAAEAVALARDMDEATCPECHLLGTLADDGAGGFRCTACGYLAGLPAESDPGWDRLLADLEDKEIVA